MATTYRDLVTPRTASGSAETAAKQQAIDLAMISPKITSTPTSAPAPATTVARNPSAYEKALADRTAATKTYEEQKTVADIYAANQRQARIDAINTAFAPRIRREEKAGEERIQRVKSLAFKGGITGSGIDTTKIGDQTKLNEAALRDIEAAKATAIQEAFDKADSLAASMAEGAFNRSLKSAEANVEEQKNRLNTAMESLKLFSAGGGVKSASDLRNSDPMTYDNLRSASGMSDAEIDTYLKVNAPKGTYEWNQAKFSGNKMYVPTIKNGVPSMEEIDLNFTPDREVEGVTKTDTGVFILYKDGTYKTVGIPSDKTIPSSELKVYINQQIATPEFKKLTDEQKADYIRSQGGTPYDFGF